MIKNKYLLICDLAYFFFINDSNIRVWLEYSYYNIVLFSRLAFYDFVTWTLLIDNFYLFNDSYFDTYDFWLVGYLFLVIFFIWFSNGFDLGAVGPTLFLYVFFISISYLSSYNL
jgi:hypothetical protein